MDWVKGANVIGDTSVESIDRSVSGGIMIPRIESLKTRENYQLEILFENGECVLYDVGADIATISDFEVLKFEPHFFENVQVDETRTCVYWNDRIDLPSDTLLEYGKRMTN